MGFPWKSNQKSRIRRSLTARNACKEAVLDLRPNRRTITLDRMDSLHGPESSQCLFLFAR